MTPGFKKGSTASKKQRKITSSSSESGRSESPSEEPGSEEEVLEEDDTEEDWHPDLDEASEELTLETQEEEEGRPWHENGGGDKDLRGEGSLWYIIPGYENHVEKGWAKQRSCLHILVERLSEVRCEPLPSSCVQQEHQVGEDRRIPWDEDGDSGMEAIQSCEDEIIDPLISVSSGDIKEEVSPPDVTPSVAGDAGSSRNHISSVSPFPVLSVSAEHTTLLPVSMILEYDGIVLKQEEKEDKDSQTEQRREQEQISEPVAAEYLLDLQQQQPAQAEATTDTLSTSQNHCPPSSGPGSAVCVSHCPARVPHNHKKKALGWRRRRSLRLPAAQGCCGRDKAQDRRRERRELVMIDSLQQICEAQHKIINVLDQLCSKQATLIKLVQRLSANMKSRR
ncbi:uncharacterized protein LOC115363416 [Myripristis murdjan]|uniref:uncharacterized protein LOC115363416 n=1 Tax=Myripristis murdjan TaxID=586833 RepID=UPI001175E19B|nr:uncharacterized protein LOC115363416 [Myripristis murdjan]